MVKKKAGRPPGSKNKEPLSDWEPLATTVEPEINEWLQKKKAEGFTLNVLINNTLKDKKNSEATQ